jgi:hypothetical protein
MPAKPSRLARSVPFWEAPASQASMVSHRQRASCETCLARLAN